MVDSFDRLWDPFDPGETGIDLPFFMNQPKSQCPPQKKILSADILHHQGSTFYLYLIQVGFPEIPLGTGDNPIFEIFSLHFPFLNKPLALPSPPMGEGEGEGKN
jgi:hypothetical protein